MNSAKNICKQVFEDELITGFLKSDKQCFSEIYELYSDKLFGLILKWVKEQKTAETLLCNAFVRAWQGRKLFNPQQEHFYWWLCRHARMCYNEFSGEAFRKHALPESV